MRTKTKNLLICKWVFFGLDMLCSWGLMLGFLIYGFASGENVQRYMLGCIGLAGAVIMAVSIIMKKHWLTPVILAMVGLYFAVDKFSAVIITCGCAIVLDELLIHPLFEFFKHKYSVNIEIDKARE